MEFEEWARKFLSVSPPARGVTQKPLISTASTYGVNGKVNGPRRLKKAPILMKPRSPGMSTLMQQQMELHQKLKEKRLIVLKGRRNIFSDPWYKMTCIAQYFYLNNPGVELNLASYQKAEMELLAKLKEIRISDTNNGTNSLLKSTLPPTRLPARSENRKNNNIQGLQKDETETQLIKYPINKRKNNG